MAANCKNKKKCPRCDAQHAKQCKCRLRPYSEGCPGGQTPHHVIPDHCWREKGKGGQRYSNSPSHGGGLCVCVKGHGKVGEHGDIHDLFDKKEAALAKKGTPKGTASLNALENAGVDAVHKGMKPPKCNKRDLKAQLKKHHKGRRQKLRADPFGQNPNPPSLSNKTASTTMGL